MLYRYMNCGLGAAERARICGLGVSASDDAFLVYHGLFGTFPIRF